MTAIDKCSAEIALLHTLRVEVQDQDFRILFTESEPLCSTGPSIDSDPIEKTLMTNVPFIAGEEVNPTGQAD
jgi:hypothetical protein